MNSSKLGILAIVLACVIWGFAPVYYKMLINVPPIELLAHRTVWSFLFFFGVLICLGKARDLKNVFIGTKTRVNTIAISSLLIAVNWFFFIAAVQTNQVTEASLGYFIMPLVTVFWGLIIFKEKLSFLQLFSVFLAAVAVCILTYGLGAAPWIALILSFSFSIYAVLKKKVEISSIVSVTGEVLILTPVGLLFIFYFHAVGQGSFGSDLKTSFLLTLAGPLTALPLILFSYGTRRINLSTAGLLQYLNPSLQFLCATYIFLEPLTFWHLISFPIIWIALLLYSSVGIKYNNEKLSSNG